MFTFYRQGMFISGQKSTISPMGINIKDLELVQMPLNSKAMRTFNSTASICRKTMIRKIKLHINYSDLQVV